MRIAVFGDAHLISDLDPYKGLHEIRSFFKSAWPSFRTLLDQVNEESPDLVILLGDLVDWFSPENVDFGLDLLSTLTSPWLITPGNHDLAAPKGDSSLDTYRTKVTESGRGYWVEQGIDFSNWLVAEGIVVIDSATSTIAEGTGSWLDGVLRKAQNNLLFTHVPIDEPSVRKYILSVDPGRNLGKYVMGGAPDLFDRHLAGRVSEIFTGHLHFPGELTIGATKLHLCDMSITMRDPNRKSSCRASVKIIEHNSRFTEVRELVVE